MVTAIEIRRISATSWKVIPDGIEADFIQDPYYRGNAIGDNITIKATNGAVYFKDINYQFVSYTDELDSGNDVASFSDASEVIEFLKDVGFFAVSSGGGSGSSTFLGLSDVAVGTFIGKALQVLRINAAATAVESFFMNIVQAFTDLVDTPSTIEPLKYLRGNAGGTALEFTDGFTVNQNNIGRIIKLGYFSGVPTAEDVRDAMNAMTITITEIQTPVIVYLTNFPSFSSPASKIYPFIFKPGKGTYGIGGTLVLPIDLFALPVNYLTPADIENDPNAIIQNLDPVVDGDYITKANTSFWDFSDSGEPGTDGGTISYYFTYTDDGVLYYALFVGTPGEYGTGATPFVETDFVDSTNSNVQPTDDFFEFIIPSTIELATLSHIRNDQSSIIRLANGDLIAAYSRFDASFLDTEPSRVYASRSTDNGLTWGTPFMLQDIIGSNIGSYIPSLYKKSDGNILMVFFVRVTATPLESKIYKKLFDADMNPIGSEVEITMPTGYYPFASDRLFYDEDTDKLLFPYPKLLSIVGAIYVFEGRILESSDEGDNWTDSGIATGSTVLDITGKGGPTESGIFRNPLGGLVYYYRTTIGTVNGVPLTESGGVYSFGTTYKIMDGGDSQSTIKYWGAKKILVGSRMRNIDFGVNNRTRLDVLTSIDGISWDVIDELDFTTGSFRLNEPTIFLDDEYCLIPYSKATLTTTSLDLIAKRYDARFFHTGYVPLFYNGVVDDGKGNLYNGYQRFVASGASVTKVQNPNGGGYKSATNTTGAIKITLPTNSATPITIKGTVNTPVANKSFTFEISVLASSMATNSVTIQGADNSVNYTVRFVNATKPIIFIGELASTWSIPHITIDEISASTVGIKTVVEGWEIGFEATSFGTVVSTKTNSLPYSNLSQALLGLAAGSNTAITAANTKLEAFANLQAQVDVTKLVSLPAVDLNAIGGFNRYIFSSSPTNAPASGNWIIVNYGNASLSSTNRQLAFSLSTPDMYTRTSVSQPWYKVWTEHNMIPRPYKVYSALLTQTGTSAPTATVLENTIGAIVWSRNAAGQYYATLASAFTANKTHSSITIGSVSGGASPRTCAAYVLSTSIVVFSTFDAGSGTDNQLTGASIEIRVYN